MVATSLARDTVAMAGSARGTAFVTGSDGFLGTELIKLLVSRGHRVLALTRSVEGAETMRRIDAVPVMGTCSHQVDGRTRLRPTGSFIFRRRRQIARASFRNGGPRERAPTYR